MRRRSRRSAAKRRSLLQVLERAVEMGQQSQQDKRAGQLNMFGGGSAGAAPSCMAHDALPDVDELPDAELLKFEKELLGFYITSHPLTEHQMALEHYLHRHPRKEALTCAEGTEVTIGGMINRVKKSVTKNGRSAGHDDGDDHAGRPGGPDRRRPLCRNAGRRIEALSRRVSAERIVFLRGKIDRRRETPSIVVNDLIPIEDAIGKLTTAIALKLDPAPHAGRRPPNSIRSSQAQGQRRGVSSDHDQRDAEGDHAARSRAVREAEPRAGG